ncbi:hypothetical protein ACOSQ4_030205 [Xanthoceras sorbifolium]
MSRVKSLVDDLALIGHPLNDAQIMSYTLNGLVDEFKELTATIRVHDTPISFEDLYDKLLDEELIRNHGEPNEPKEKETQVTAQLAQKRSNYKGHGGRGNRGNQNTTTHDSIGKYPQPVSVSQPYISSLVLSPEPNISPQNNSKTSSVSSPKQVQPSRMLLRIPHFHTTDQLVDSLTKPLTKQHFHVHRSKLSILPGPLRLWGHDRVQN